MIRDISVETRWLPQVVSFLTQNIPRGRASGWRHHHITAFEVGCQLLVTLGLARETAAGALPVDPPRRCATLPRWDDVATAVLFLADQNGLISCFSGDVTIGPPAMREEIGWTRIEARGTCGGAFATAETHDVLKSLGLLDGNRWTVGAEAVLWRMGPEDWDFDLNSNARFTEACERACTDIPDDIRAQLDRIAFISASEMAAWEAEWAALPGEGPTARVKMLARDSLRNARRYGADCLFFHRWRFGDGWLSRQDARAALFIPYDRVAIEARKAVVRRLFPGMAWLAE